MNVRGAVALCAGVAAMLWCECSSPTQVAPPSVSLNNAIGTISVGGATEVNGSVTTTVAVSDLLRYCQQQRRNAARYLRHRLPCYPLHRHDHDRLKRVSRLGHAADHRNDERRDDYRSICVLCERQYRYGKLHRRFLCEMQRSAVRLISMPPHRTSCSAQNAVLDGSGVDIIMTYSSAYSAFRIFNPVYAADNSNINAFAGWVSPEIPLLPGFGKCV